MKNLKKLIASGLAVATLGTLTLTPISASALMTDSDFIENELTKDEFTNLRWVLIDELDVIENGPVIIVIKNEDGEERDRVIFDYITLEESEIIGYGTQPDGEEYVVRNNGPYVKKIDETVDTSEATKEIVAYVDTNVLNIYFYDGNSYNVVGWFEYSVGVGTYSNLESLVTLDMLEEQYSTIGESESTSITEFTIGESTYPRGDINFDGKVNTLDLLMLKKYLLGLMEW